MKHLSFYNTIKVFPDSIIKFYQLNLNKVVDKIAGKDENFYAKTTNSFVKEQNNFHEIDSLQWDEYGNPYMYSEVC